MWGYIVIRITVQTKFVLVSFDRAFVPVTSRIRLSIIICDLA